MLRRRRGPAYVALERHALVDAEDQDHMAAVVKRIREYLLVLHLRRPEAVAHGSDDVVVIPGFDHEVADTWTMVSI